MRSRRLRGAVAIALLAATVAGCTGLPTDSEVVAQRVPRVEGDGNEPVRVIPPEPRADMTALELAAGFLRAQTDAADRHGIARSYLTPAAARAWNDEAQVHVYTDSPVIREVGPGAVEVTVQAVAVINPDGSYSPTAQSLRDVFLASRTGDVLRLSSVPQGLWLQPQDITRSYRRLSLYYLTGDADTVVPDPRFLPRRRSDVAGALVESLLGPPSAWLRPAVTTAIPQGARLLGTSVEDDGTIEVDLSSAAGRVSGRQRERLVAQLVWTLTQLPELRGVRLLIDGERVRVGGSDARRRRVDVARFNPDGVTDRAPVTFNLPSGQVARQLPDPRPGEDDRRPDSRVDPPLLSKPAVSPADQTLAGVGCRRRGDVCVVAGDGAPVVRFPAREPRTLSWGSGRWGVFVLDGPDPGRLVLVPPEGTPRVVQLVTRRRLDSITDLRVSRDGARVALIASDTLWVGVVVRRGDGRLQVLNLRQLPLPQLTRLSDVVWAGPTSLYVLAVASAGAAKLPVLVQVDGSTITPLRVGGLPGEATAIAAAPDRPLVLEAGGPDGAGLWRVDAGLANRITDGSAPSYPG